MEIVHQDTTGDKHAYHLGQQLTNQQKKRITALMESYPKVLAVSFEEIKGANTKYKHNIDTEDHKPIKQAPYHLPPHYKQWV